MADVPVAPTADLELAWAGDLRFDGTSGAATIALDGDASAGPTPVQALLFGLAGCMAIDLVVILRKGRHPLQGLRARLHAERAPEAPKRVTRVELRFQVTGDIPAAAVQRAIDLSRQTYCSVWHSVRQDIEFVTSFEIGPV
jgi:putative redox protein